LVAQRDAKAFLLLAQKEKRRVKDEEVAHVLNKWAFAKNGNRANVFPEGQSWVFSDTLGLVRDRVGDIHPTVSTLFYPDVTRLFCRWLQDRLPKEAKDFRWTSINVNCNYAGRLHRDGNNFGPSMISAFGDFTGGELNYFPEDDKSLDLDDLSLKEPVQLELRKNEKSNVVMFNGNCGHFVNPFKGTRFSLVYFTVSCFKQARESDKLACRDLGLNYTLDDDDPHRHLRLPLGYGSGKGPAKKASGVTYRLTEAKSFEATKFQPPPPQKSNGAAEKTRQEMETTRSRTGGGARNEDGAEDEPVENQKTPVKRVSAAAKGGAAGKKTKTV